MYLSNYIYMYIYIYIIIHLSIHIDMYSFINLDRCIDTYMYIHAGRTLRPCQAPPLARWVRWTEAAVLGRIMSSSLSSKCGSHSFLITDQPDLAPDMHCTSCCASLSGAVCGRIRSPPPSWVSAMPAECPWGRRRTHSPHTLSALQAGHAH